MEIAINPHTYDFLLGNQNMTDTKLHKILDEMNVPRDVWIGTNSTADRLEWLKRRKEALERTCLQRLLEITLTQNGLTQKRTNSEKGDSYCQINNLPQE